MKKHCIHESWMIDACYISTQVTSLLRCGGCHSLWAFLCQNPGYSPGLISTYRTYRRSVKLTCLEELWGRTLSIYKQRFMDFSLATKSLSPPMMASCSAPSGLEAKDSFIRNHSQTRHSLCFDDCCLNYACRTCVFGPHHSSS